MKKSIIALLILALCFTNLYAAADTIVEKSSDGTYLQPLMQQLGDSDYLATVQGKQYIYYGSGGLVREYDEAGYNYFNRFAKEDGDVKSSGSDSLYGYSDFIKAGDNYMVRFAKYTGDYYYYPTYPVKLFDANFKLLKEYTFEHGYVTDLCYFNGIYYCYLDAYYPNANSTIDNLQPERIMRSNDFEKWEDVTDKIGQFPYVIKNALYSPKKNTTENRENSGDSISFDGVNFTLLVYEGSDMSKSMGVKPMASLVLKGFSQQGISGNGIYFAFNEIEGAINYIYEYNDELILENSFVRYRLPKQDVYAGLDSLENAPFVEYNNIILSFERPPVVENGHTLVPMRFLFEQMGATVKWDNATQTATAAQEGNIVTFGVDNITAMVNDAEKAMDIAPQLINNKTYVPLRFLSENLGYNVKWDDVLNRIIIAD